MKEYNILPEFLQFASAGQWEFSVARDEYFFLNSVEVNPEVQTLLKHYSDIMYKKSLNNITI